MVSMEMISALAEDWGCLLDYMEDNDLGWSRYVAFRAKVDI